MRARNIKPEDIERVVVRGANWVGDAVMTVPALRELRRALPGAHIALATRPWAEGIFEGADFIDELLPLGGKTRGAAALLAQARELRRRRFDLAVLLPNAFAPALAAFAARVPLRVGYATDGRRALLTHPLPAPPWRGQRHEVFYYLNLVAELERLLRGRATVGAGAPRVEPEPHATSAGPLVELAVSDERLRAARTLLREAGAREGLPLVAVCPGSTNSRAKRWPPERFAAVADLLCARDGAQVLLVGAAEEREVSEEVARRMTHRPLILTGRTTLSQTAAVLASADLLLTNDTGPAHLAAAVGCPVVVVFGPTNPLTTRPFSDSAEVVRRPPDCAPCMLRDCPIDHRCMTAVTPEEVYAGASAVVSRARRLEVAR